MTKTRVVIAGGGFAGLYAAKYFDKRLVRPRRRRGDANQSREFHFVHARLQELDPGEIAFRDFAFRLNKSRNDKKVPDPVGSAVFVLQKLLVSQYTLHHFSEAAAFTRCNL